MYEYELIGKRIKECRKRKHLTQEMLAEKVNVSTQHISHVERGISKVSVVALINIANALNVSMDELFCDTIKQSNYIFEEKINYLLKDCDSNELSAITEVITNTKDIMRKYEENISKKYDKKF